MTSQAERLRVAATAPANDSGGGPIAKFQKFLDGYRSQMAAALPRHLDPDRMCRLAVTAFSQNAELQNCDARSVIGAIMTASQLGLEIGVQGQGFLVPYFDSKAGIKKAQFIPGWQGLVDLVARAGRATVWTGVIFKDQTYTFSDGARKDLVIHNETALEDPEDITHAYAIGWVKDAQWPIIELWRVEKIAKHRDRHNKQGKGHYSYRNWEMYARKIPLLQVLKYVPKSIELQFAVDLANSAEGGRAATFDGQAVNLGADMGPDPADNNQPPALTDDTQAQDAGRVPQQTAAGAEPAPAAAPAAAPARAASKPRESSKSAPKDETSLTPRERAIAIAERVPSIADDETAYLTLDDARFMASEMSGKDLADVTAAIAKAEQALKARSGAGQMSLG